MSLALVMACQDEIFASDFSDYESEQSQCHPSKEESVVAKEPRTYTSGSNLMSPRVLNTGALQRNTHADCCHHNLDSYAINRWIYPKNVERRDYQFNIVRKALYTNVLVSLPTGYLILLIMLIARLGKTFIAACVMLNWLRWAPSSKVIFLAPTKPLVQQQLNACQVIAGIERSKMALLTGATQTSGRTLEWQRKQVFFCTPQIVENDLKKGICNAAQISCLVVDEAHRATGAYAYCTVATMILKSNKFCRILALTATPGSSVEAVQSVIDALQISRVEIRTEESLDVRSYVNKKHICRIVLQPTPQLEILRTLLVSTIDAYLGKLREIKAWALREPMDLTSYGCRRASLEYMKSAAARDGNPGLVHLARTLFSILSTLAQALNYLLHFGLRPFLSVMRQFRSSVLSRGKSAGKWGLHVLNLESFQKLMSLTEAACNDPALTGHPKLDETLNAVTSHLETLESATRGRVIVFTTFRESALEIYQILEAASPLVKPHLFIGQSTAKGERGMSQREQSSVIEQFKHGMVNVLVATCVGEEGLDIGEVDLIIAYDASASPIRTLQRMGRTGRKEAGNILLLMMQGNEEKRNERAQHNYRTMQELIVRGDQFTFHTSPRILPKEVKPELFEEFLSSTTGKADAGGLPRMEKRPERSLGPRLLNETLHKVSFVPAGSLQLASPYYDNEPAFLTGADQNHSLNTTEITEFRKSYALNKKHYPEGMFIQDCENSLWDCQVTSYNFKGSILARLITAVTSFVRLEQKVQVSPGLHPDCSKKCFIGEHATSHSTTNEPCSLVMVASCVNTDHPPLPIVSRCTSNVLHAWGSQNIDAKENLLLDLPDLDRFLARS